MMYISIQLPWIEKALIIEIEYFEYNGGYTRQDISNLQGKPMKIDTSLQVEKYLTKFIDIHKLQESICPFDGFHINANTFPRVHIDLKKVLHPMNLQYTLIDKKGVREFTVDSINYRDLDMHKA